MGSRLGQSLNKFENSLAAYAFDLFGSILGVVCFTVMSYLQTGPLVWFSISGIVILFLLRKGIKSRRYFLGVMFILIGIFATLAQKGNWSPYYKVWWAPYPSSTGNPNKFLGYAIFVNDLRIQDALRFSETLANHPNLGAWIPYYRLPYHFRKPRKVLVLGGGAGNDATMALLYDAERVDVVEIDPVILRLGYTLHPHKPYLDPRVRTINDDARSFLRKSNEKYDLIVMNALDSHHLAGQSINT
jgi:predicted membrane-bound spermidine synthase